MALYSKALTSFRGLSPGNKIAVVTAILTGLTLVVTAAAWLFPQSDTANESSYDLLAPEEVAGAQIQSDKQALTTVVPRDCENVVGREAEDAGSKIVDGQRIGQIYMGPVCGQLLDDDADIFCLGQAPQVPETIRISLTMLTGAVAPQMRILVGTTEQAVAILDPARRDLEIVHTFREAGLHYVEVKGSSAVTPHAVEYRLESDWKAGGCPEASS